MRILGCHAALGCPGMNYRHAYHAGNFADVLKHAVLVGLLEALKQKQTPFCYLDSHAGAGRYDLHSAEAQEPRAMSRRAKSRSRVRG